MGQQGHIEALAGGHWMALSAVADAGEKRAQWWCQKPRKHEVAAGMRAPLRPVVSMFHCPAAAGKAPGIWICLPCFSCGQTLWLAGICRAKAFVRPFERERYWEGLVGVGGGTKSRLNQCFGKESADAEIECNLSRAL